MSEERDAEPGELTPPTEPMAEGVRGRAHLRNERPLAVEPPRHLHAAAFRLESCRGGGPGEISSGIAIQDRRPLSGPRHASARFWAMSFFRWEAIS